MGRYDDDVLAGPRRPRRSIPVHEAEPQMVVEDADSGFCGAVVGFEGPAVILADRHGKRRVFPLEPAAFLLDGVAVTLTRPKTAARPAGRRTASGSIAVQPERARVARAGRIWVEGLHDAALVERVWGDDLRVEGLVAEPLDGIDGLAARIAEFRPNRQARLGVLVDHLVAGSKESRIVAGVQGPHVLVTGHPFVDIWQAPAAGGRYHGMAGRCAGNPLEGRRLRRPRGRRSGGAVAAHSVACGRLPRSGDAAHHRRRAAH